MMVGGRFSTVIVLQQSIQHINDHSKKTYCDRRTTPSRDEARSQEVVAMVDFIFRLTKCMV
jgi:hypothetical protein